MIHELDWVRVRQADPKKLPIALQIPKALHIAKTLGMFAAARYMAKRKWSLEAALWVLLRKTVREQAQKQPITTIRP